jgi:hypothetical protein
VSIFDLTVDQIPDAPVVWGTLNSTPVSLKDQEWQHPTSETERLDELEQFLARDFDTFREVCIAQRAWNGRIDLLAVPKLFELDWLALAFEVKGARFDVERALKQSADYVGGRVLDGPHKGKHVAACLLYPTQNLRFDAYHAGMFQLIAQWRVGRGYVHRGDLWLAIGQEVIWDSRGWHETVANRMLVAKRAIGGSRREFNHGHVELSDWRRF